LLRNRGGLLPLKGSQLKTIAVLGPHAGRFTAGGYSGQVKDPVTPLQGIFNHARPGTVILHTVGAEITPRLSPGGQVPTAFNQAEELRLATAAARKADIAIVYVGTTLDVEAEGRDRTSLALPGNQEELIRTVVAANPRTVVVLMSAGPLAVPWIKDHAGALMQAWWAGEEGGNAIADVLFGDANPGGRLPYTMYAADNQVPSPDEYDISRGFTYMYLRGKPLFPFGHGLSYTTFKYSRMEVFPAAILTNGLVRISVDVKNTGQRTGDEVVQLYLRPPPSRVVRPTKELRGFERINLRPGEQRRVSFAVPADRLAFYDESAHRFEATPGVFGVLVGSSSEDIRLQGGFTVR
jgi:beta-glucosidase